MRNRKIPTLPFFFLRRSLIIPPPLILKFPYLILRHLLILLTLLKLKLPRLIILLLTLRQKSLKGTASYAEASHSLVTPEDINIRLFVYGLGKVVSEEVDDLKDDSDMLIIRCF